MKHAIKDSAFILLGITSATFGLKGFLIPNHFIDGGAMGISMLASQFSNISLGIFISLLNTPFILLASAYWVMPLLLKPFLPLWALVPH